MFLQREKGEKTIQREWYEELRPMIVAWNYKEV